MATFDERMRSSTRRGSVVSMQQNPLEITTDNAAKAIKMENLGCTQQINGSELVDLIEKLKRTR
jgi:hypothetical protein